MKRFTAPGPLTRRKLAVALSILALVTASLVGMPTSAHSIDYLAANISPAASFNGGSGNFTLNAPVAGGTSITFDVTFSINTMGSTTTYPRTIGFGVEDTTGPAVPTATLSTSSFTFTSVASNFTTQVTVVAPSTAGAYSVKIGASTGTGGSGGLNGGNGVVVNFTVLPDTTPICVNAATSVALVLANDCIVYGTASTSFTATLTSGSNPVSGKSIDFTVDGNSIGSAITGINGAATVNYNPSALAVGDHTVVASFQGDGCDYLSSSNSATLGVQYMFQGFQQPINADGSSQFGGRTIPVKIRILDASGNPVPDAEAHVYFAFGTPIVVGTDAEPVANTNGDSGNLMRYDPVAQQYIFNWDIAGLANGTYTIRVGLGEGTCAGAHTVVVSLKKKGSK